MSSGAPSLPLTTVRWSFLSVSLVILAVLLAYHDVSAPLPIKP